LAQRPFYAGGAHGFYGFIFADLGSHDYVVEREQSNRPTRKGPETTTRTILDTTIKKENGKVVEMVSKREVYTPLLLANTSPLPPDVQRFPRKLRKVHPLLTCIRALWEYQRNGHGVLPFLESAADLELFMKIAREKHKELQLPSDTLTAEFLHSFLRGVGCEIAPVTAILGGQLAQDVINVLGKREQPIQNLALLDGDRSEGPIYTLHPIISDPLPIIQAEAAGAAVEID
jgi:ubiquitin-like 1-activating enzyme E1 A